MKPPPLITQKKFYRLFVTDILAAFNAQAFLQVSILLMTFKLSQTLPRDEANFYVSLGTGFFLLPGVLFSIWAATVADRIGTSRAIVGTRLLVICTMTLGLLVFLILDPAHPIPAIRVLMMVFFFMGTQSSLYRLAKFAIVPQLLEDRELAGGNGLLATGSFASLIAGTFAAGLLVEWFGDRPYLMSVIFLLIAVIGWLTSKGIPATAPVDTTRPFSIFFPAEIWRNFKTLRQNRVVFLAGIGICFFWSFYAALQQIFPGYGAFVGAGAAHTSIMMVAFLVGIGIGSALCGPLSSDKVEMGLIPFGALGMTLFCVLFGFAYPETVAGYTDMLWTYAMLAGMGIFSGFVLVPLNALLQQRTAEEERARMIALVHIMTGLFAVASTGFVIACRSVAGLSEPQIVQLLGILLICCAAYACWLLPEFLVRFVLWLFTNTVYRIRVLHRERIPLSGAHLLVSNHLSFVDAAMVQMVTHRSIRFVIGHGIYNIPSARFFFKLMGAIPTYPRRHPQFAEGFAHIKQALDKGDLVCIFPEGQISRTGNTFKFQKGMERILAHNPVPVIPIYLHGMWGSIFSYSRGKFLWKLPPRLPYPVTVAVGRPMPSDTTAERTRQAVMELGVAAALSGKSKQPLLHQKVLQQARRRPFRRCLVDHTGAAMTRLKTCLEAKRLARVINDELSEPVIGVLLPPSVEAAVVNLALAMAGKIALNINDTLAPDQIETIVQESGIQTTLTTAEHLSALPKPPCPGLTEVAGLLPNIALSDRVATFLSFFLVPAKWQAAPGHIDDTVAVVHTAGTTGKPKGVKLSHYNILTNAQSLSQVLLTAPDDCLITGLPFFHAYGLSLTCWLPLLAGMAVAYGPFLDMETSWSLAEGERGSMFLATPQILDALAQQENLPKISALNYIICGGSPLSRKTADTLERQLDLTILEGYGAAECSPLVAVNVPSVRRGKDLQEGLKPGSLGRVLPGICIKILDPETQKTCQTGQPGILWVKGPNVADGYFNNPRETSRLMKDGWFCTGDVVIMDDSGFLFMSDPS